jgi:two-component system chemotaxis response regulator CheY
MKGKILIVDDSGLARRLTRKYLEELGYEVEEATDGAQALERYALNRVHDVNLQKMEFRSIFCCNSIYSGRYFSHEFIHFII